MSSKISKIKQQRARTQRRIIRLRDLGLIDKKTDARKEPTRGVRNALLKYKDLLDGRAQAIRAPKGVKASSFRQRFKFRGKGDVVVIPKEKGEKYVIQKSGDLVSRRKGEGGEIIKKTVSEKFKPRPANARVYYTLPEKRRGSAGRLKRKTFANLDELLYYLSQYDVNFDDVEPYIEVEEFEKNSRQDKTISAKIRLERAAAIQRRKRRKKREAKAKTKRRKSS